MNLEKIQKNNVDIRSMGRPRTYKEEYVEDLLSMKKEGKFDCEICSKWEISRDTYYRWIKEYPSLKEAADQGKQSFQAYWVTTLKSMALTGQDKGFKPVIAILNNQCRDEWYQDNNKPTTQINIQNNTVNNQLTVPELESKLKQNLTFLKDNNIIDADFLKLENLDGTSEDNRESP